ncbi:hypothetical protein [Maribacter arcticus]|jgi:hypothetical protein|uniref:Uncharacterized protein n=1 Tax=Maribacter arcticus TaxID=561365 RepID=A0A1T4ZYC7_9FLAO|nr:hypothetical protein [Maribacter arcticus]SKB27728.1 hypothetical protein SAMN05660866_00489 [Maribacter arcticus]
MNSNTIYIILGVVFAIYLVIRITSRGKSSDRKSRKFMGDYERKEKKDN